MEVGSWVTPSSLFVLLNLIIGTILLTAKLQNQNQNQNRSHARPLARATSSMIDRVRSINLSLYQFDPQHHNPTPQLTRSPSLLDRLKSAYKPDPEPAIRLVDATNETGRPTRELARSPSLLERLKSVCRSDPEPEKRPAQDHEVRRSKSEHAKTQVVRAKRKKMTKSASDKGLEIPKGRAEDEDDTAVERRRPATTTTRTLAAAEGTGVDAQADDFINKFRQQLRLQRLESLKRITNLIHGK